MTLRVGVVGLGFAGQTHLRSYKQIPGVEVVALAGKEADVLQRVADEEKVPHRYADWEDLVARDDLDAVSVCTPTFLHAPIAIAALEGGRHVLSEKPLARSSVEAQDMVDASLKADRVLATAFNHRRRGDVTTLKKHIDTGSLGRIYYAKAAWLRRSGIPGLGSWFTNKEMSGGGPLIDLGVHVLDMALHLLGEPRVLSVTASTYAELGPNGRGGSAYSVKQQVNSAFEVEDIATAFLRLEGGGTLLLETSWAGYAGTGDSFGVTLFGSDGGAQIDVRNYQHEDTLRIYTDIADTPAEIRPEVRRGEGHLGVVKTFVDIVQSGDWEGHHGEEGLSRTRIIDACYKSAQLGHEVEVEVD
jgi:predicted dehydrogenase